MDFTSPSENSEDVKVEWWLEVRLRQGKGAFLGSTCFFYVGRGRVFGPWGRTVFFYVADVLCFTGLGGRGKNWFFFMLRRTLRKNWFFFYVGVLGASSATPGPL